MLLRPDGDDIIAISQPAHAWISGQLARQWGNEQFGVFSPREEVCLAAEQHDIGFLEWEHAPSLDLKTGLPHSFMAIPKGEHLEIWSRSVQDALVFSRYAAWLVSLHVSGLCRRQLKHASPDRTTILRRFLRDQSRLRSGFRESLIREDSRAEACRPAVVERNRRLVVTWDWMSLLLLQGFSGEQRVEEVPAVRGTVTLTLNAKGKACSGGVILLNPWPFGVSQVELACDGKRLTGRFSDEPTLWRALRAAPPAAVSIRLVPAAPKPG